MPNWFDPEELEKHNQRMSIHRVHCECGRVYNADEEPPCVLAECFERRLNLALHKCGLALPLVTEARLRRIVRIALQTKVCAECLGDGYLAYDGDSTPCPQCDGTGIPFYPRDYVVPITVPLAKDPAKVVEDKDPNRW